MKKKNNYIFDIFVLLGLSSILSLLNIRVCPFFYFFKIPCPGCGLSRAVISLFRFDIVKSIKYNILGLLLVIFVIIYLIFYFFRKIDYLNLLIEKNKRILICFAIVLVVIIEIININNPLLY